MKKSPSPPKPKEFSTSPFAALKGVTAGSSQAAPPGGTTPVAQKISQPDDSDLFLRAMADVQRLHEVRRPAPPKSHPPVSKPMVRKIEEEEQQLFLQVLQQLKLDVTFRDELPDDAPPPVRPSNRLRQLRRGTIRIDYELDLHGLTRDEALEALEAFIGGAYRRGQQAVLVITGKGNNSPGEPVLLGAVRKWLRIEGKGMVSETIVAPREMGGEGALVAFIRAGAGG